MTIPLRILAYKPRPDIHTIRMEWIITCEPLELEYLYTSLKDHDVTLLDGMIDHRDPVRTARKIKAQIVLITAFITNINDVLRIAKKLKKLPHPPLVFIGGPHAEVVPEHFFSDGVDGVFFANQLSGIAEVAQKISDGKPYQDVAGAAFSNNGQFEKNPIQGQSQWDLPIPDRVLFNKHPDRYFYLYFKRCASIKTAVGCPEKCNFCFCTQMNGGKYKVRPLDKVIEEIKEIPEKNIFVLDDNFLTSKKRVLEFCDLIEEQKIEKRFVIYGGARFIANHPEIMARLKEVGVTAVIVGFESIEDNELQTMNKGASAADNDRVVEICQDLDIELFALFIVNSDWRKKDFIRLARYIYDRSITFPTFSTHTEFPDANHPALTNKNTGNGKQNKFNWWRYDLLRLHEKPAHMSRLEYYSWLLFLYSVPTFNSRARKQLLKRYGKAGLAKAGLRGWMVLLNMSVKLAVWR